MTLRTRRILTTICVAAILGTSFASSPEKPLDDDTPAQKLASLSWMAGHWQASNGKQELEEIWSPPRGDSLMGAFRWIKEDKVWMFELMNITVEGDDVVFRLRHFDRDLVPWEGKAKEDALTYKLEQLSEKMAVFENPGRDKPRQFVFERPDEETFLVRLVGPGGGRGQEFRYHR